VEKSGVKKLAKMFIGEYTSTVGEKNRIAMPKKLREEIKGKSILTRGYENCLILFDQDRFNYFINEINKTPLLKLDLRDTKRFILGGAQEIEFDNQGRFVLSESLKSFANIQSKITFLGVGEWIEIWDEEKWIKKLTMLSENVADIADRLRI
jgi:MraZ protein